MFRSRLKTPRAAAIAGIVFAVLLIAVLLLFRLSFEAAFALFFLLSGRYIEWILMLFPLWVLLISIYILIDNLRQTPQAAATGPET